MVKLGELPKISVTIPTYNRKKMLKRAIDSVLAQDYKNIEVIVSDNASTDGTDTLMQEYANDSRIIYIRNLENIGPVKNGRQAYLKATGKYIMILCDDDMLVYKSFFSDAVCLMEKKTNIGITSGYIRFSPFIDAIKEDVNDNYVLIEPRFYLKREYKGIDYYIHHYIYGFQPFVTFFFLINKELLDSLNIMNDDTLVAHDFFIWRMAPLYKDVAYLPEIIGEYCVENEGKDSHSLRFGLRFERFYKQLQEVHNLALKLYPEYKTKINKFSGVRRQAKETLPLFIEALNMHLEPEKVTYLLQQSEIAKDKYLLSFLQTQSQSLTQQIKNSLGIKSSIKQLLFSIINKIYKTIK